MFLPMRRLEACQYSDFSALGTLDQGSSAAQAALTTAQAALMEPVE